MSAKRARLDGAPPSDGTPAWALALLAQIDASLDASRAATQAQLEASRAATQAQIEASRAEMQARMEAIAAQVTEQLTRLTALERAVAAGHTAMGAKRTQLAPADELPSSEPLPRPALIAHQARYAELVSLDRRVLLSPAEEVLSIPFLSERSVMSFLRQEEAPPLRAASRACRDAVAEHAWSEYAFGKSAIRGSLVSWRRCFPHATAANLQDNKALTDADMVLLRGIHTLRVAGCTGITDAGLENVSGVYELGLDNCPQISDAGLAHISGIHTLTMGGCKLVTDAGLSHLSGIHTLYLANCTLVTDAGLAHIRGVYNLELTGCSGVTNAGLAHLTGIHSLYMRYCTQITDAGMVHLRGIRELYIEGCPQLTAAALVQLEGATIHR